MSEHTLASSRPFIFHPLVVLFFSLVGSVLYALYATLRSSGGNLWSHYFYVAPIVIPFVAFLFDRAERFRQLTAVELVVDALVVVTAMWRVFGHLPYISGHALFLTYALLSTRSRVAQITAAIVMLQVIYLKYIVWNDWVTSTCGIALGLLAALVIWRFGSRSMVEPKNAARFERTALNAEGDFYVIKETCLTCLAPQHEAPELMGLDEETGCYFRRQPQTPDELEHAIEAVHVSCVAALRYAGSDPAILERIRAKGEKFQCDALFPDGG